jgi:hypothetical protein
MRGFAAGSFALVVLYVALQPNSPKATAAAGGVIVAGLRRLLSADVAGIPQRRGAPAAGKGSISPGSTVGDAVGSAVRNGQRGN